MGQSQLAAGALYCRVLPTLQLTELNSCEKAPCKHTPTAVHIMMHTRVFNTGVTRGVPGLVQILHGPEGAPS